MRTLLTAQELAALTKYSESTIVRGHVARALVDGVHYVRPFGGKRKLYIWEAIEHDMFNPAHLATSELSIPMANGGTFHG
jgi:hypothetical protein